MFAIIRRTAALLLSVLMLFAPFRIPVTAADGEAEAPEVTVDHVIELLAQIDSLQEMQDKKIVHRRYGPHRKADPSDL